VEFGKRFRFLREQICGLPEAGGRDPFAEAIEVNRKTVEKWESKKQDNIPNGETLRRIVKTFEKPEINLILDFVERIQDDAKNTPQAE